MSDCKYESEIKRLCRILDGDGKEGLVAECIEMKVKMSEMDANFDSVKELAEANAKAVSAFAKYQSSQEVLDDYKRRDRQQKRQLWFFVIAQSLAVIALAVTVVLNLLKR